MFRFAAGALVLACVLTPVRGEWSKVADEWPDLTQVQKDWFIRQHNSSGFLCCSAADGHPVDWDIRDGHYWAYWDEKWQKVPDDVVIKVPNPVGRAVLWVNQSKQFRCFIPGSGA